MKFTTTITPEQLAQYTGEHLVVIDCRFDITDPAHGRHEYGVGHIPGAFFADLETDLSGPVIPGSSGRHPLPSQKQVEALFSRWGVTESTQICAYDAGAGAMAASRLWWIAQWVGHDAVAVLDGGVHAWIASNGVLTIAEPSHAASAFVARMRNGYLAQADDVSEALRSGRSVIDSRARDRYRGENETIDAVAGHIPGAASRPFMENVDAPGNFCSQESLARGFADLGVPGEQPPIFYCGSGVTAAHNVLAYRIAFGDMPQLYAGSWSEWITDTTRPVRIGDQR